MKKGKLKYVTLKELIAIKKKRTKYFSIFPPNFFDNVKVDFSKSVGK